MPRRRAVFDLSPSRLELTVYPGSGVPWSKSERIFVADYNDAWPKSLEALAVPLAALVKAADAAGAETTIIYHAPTSVVLTTAVPANAGPGKALLAARLALADAANRSLAANPNDLESFWRDPEEIGSPTAGAGQQVHVLSIADAEETAVAVVRAVRSAGLNPVGLIPAESIGLASAVDAAIERSKSSSGTCVALYCGEHLSTLAAATKGRLRFVRRIGIGSEMLVDALAREIKPVGPDAKPVTLERSQAAALLYRNGIPVRGQVFDAETGLDADSVLPLVQPILQRCIVELRQSLRFGLEEEERGGTQLIVLGMGAKVGRLAQLIAEQTALKLLDSNPATPSATEVPTSSNAGLLHQWANGRQFSLRLVPAFLRREQTARRARRGMLVGFGAAASFVAFAAVNVRMDLGAQGARIDAARARLEAAQPLTSLNLRMIGAQAGVANAKQRIVARLSMATPWDAAMAALAACTPATVKISECDMIFEKGKPICRLTGRTPLPATGDANAVMRSFLDALATVPLVKSTRLGATQRADSDIGPIQTFEMTITLVDLPAFTGDSRPDFASLQPESERP